MRKPCSPATRSRADATSRDKEASEVSVHSPGVFLPNRFGYSARAMDRHLVQSIARDFQSGNPPPADRRVRARYILALKRLMKDSYEPRATGRPQTYKRNHYLAVDLILRRDHGPKRVKGSAAAEDLMNECKAAGIKITIRGLLNFPRQHRRAKDTAVQMLRDSKGPNPYEDALRAAKSYWMTLHDAATSA